jgi:hypothetical protein
MPVDHETFRYTPRIVLMTMLFMCVGSLLCTGTAVLVMDSVCQRNADDWLPIYPQSTVVVESHTFLRRFGVGVTTLRLQTHDSPVQVRRWYNDERRKNDPNPSNLLATMRYNVSPAENGGSIISLYSECAWR